MVRHKCTMRASDASCIRGKPNSAKPACKPSCLLQFTIRIQHSDQTNKSFYMEPSIPFRYLNFFLFSLVSISSSSSYFLPPEIVNSTAFHRNYTAISSFRVLNRRSLLQCPAWNPHLKINAASKRPTLSDEDTVTVTVSGVLVPAKDDWVAMISPSTSDVSDCHLNEAKYLQTGDLSSLPLLCHYPVKAQYVRNDPGYLGCKSQAQRCKETNGPNECDLTTTCSGTLTFDVVNIRTDIEFVLFRGGFHNPCVLARSETLKFANPNKPLHGHLSSTDSTGTSMRLSWVSGSKEQQQVQYGNGQTLASMVTTFTRDDMCSSILLPSPAKDFGWHDPGYIHSAVMTGLKPSGNFSYRYGSDSVGWSDRIQFRTPPAGGENKLKFLAFGDMGKAPRDASAEHYIQPGSLSVIKAMTEEVESGNVDSIFHIGDISYATGFLVEWDFFLNLIAPMASRVPYMTAIGNHERDYERTGSVYILPDSGGECGVPYETYFQMPTAAKDKPWYSIEQASIHFTVISTEHHWTVDSEQYEWMKKDMASIDRSKTPWLVFTGHRPMHSSKGRFNVDPEFVSSVEPLLLENKVDLVLFGHVHNYERTCSVYQSQCLAMPTKDGNGVDTYDHSNYQAPVQAVIGMAGFSLDTFTSTHDSWSLKRIAEFGYLRGHATKEEIRLEFVNAKTTIVEDSFRITKTQKR